MKTFTVVREIDISGLSGIGKVAEGVEFTNGKCIVCWCTEVSSMVIHENIESVNKIMCSHSKSTIIYDEK